MYRRSLLLHSLVCLLLGLSLACTPSFRAGNDPKGRLTEYISASFSVKGPEDRAPLMKFLTGDVKARLESWSDDQFREAFIDSKRQFLRLSFKEIKEISSNEVEITYEMSYLDQGKLPIDPSHEAKVTNKKLCQMTFEKGQWMISDVRNIKEVIEFKNALSLP